MKWDPNEITPGGKTLGQIDQGMQLHVEEGNSILQSLSGSVARVWKYSAPQRRIEILVGDPQGKPNILLCCIVCWQINGPLEWPNQRIQIHFVSDPPEKGRGWRFTLLDESVGFRVDAGGFLWRRDFDDLREESPCFGYYLGVQPQGEPGAPQNDDPKKPNYHLGIPVG